MKSIEVVRAGFGTRRSSEAPKFGTIAHQYLVYKTVLGVLIVDLLPIFTAFLQEQKNQKEKEKLDFVNVDSKEPYLETVAKYKNLSTAFFRSRLLHFSKNFWK